MKWRDLAPEPELEAFLKPRKIKRHASPEIRGRALARARAAVAAGGATALRLVALPMPVPVPVPVPVPLPAPVARGRGLMRIALAALVAVAGGAVGAFAALYSRTPESSRAVSPVGPRSAPAAGDARFADRPAESPAVVAPGRATANPARGTRAAGAGDPFAVELDLLQRAHAAYTRGNFAGALAVIAEHSRRFARGRLAEQREALRVRSLAGSGRAEESRVAAIAFAHRFPRSVLLPRIEETLPAPK